MKRHDRILRTRLGDWYEGPCIVFEKGEFQAVKIYDAPVPVKVLATAPTIDELAQKMEAEGIGR